MTKAQQAQLLDLDEKLLQLKSFIDSLSYQDANSADFIAVKNRFNQLFPSVEDLLNESHESTPEASK